MATVPQTTFIPGKYGMAKDMVSAPLGPEWLIDAFNVVANDEGYLAVRAGTTKTHASAVDGTADIEQIFEYLAADGTSRVVYSTATKLWEDYTTPTERTGAVSATAGNWKFLNFNGKVLGWQASHTPIVKTGAGNFAAISVSTGTLPDGNAACAAFGRVWASDDDKQTIRYCALLDETKWAVADGGGVIDMRTVWTQGMDEVVAIEAFGSNLVVFGKKHIVIWTDGSGSQLGLNPLNMYVTDSIEGVGALERDTVVLAGETDVVFASRSGLRSLTRTVQERATPAAHLSPSNQRDMEFEASLGTAGQFRMCYSARNSWVLYTIYNRITYVLDLRQRTPDGGFRLTEWAVLGRSVACLSTGTILIGKADSFIYSYSGELDGTIPFDAVVQTSWAPLTEDARASAFKAAAWDIQASYVQTAIFRWYTDFSTTAINDADAHNVSLSDSSGNPVNTRVPVPLSGQGHYFSIGVTIDNVNADVGNPNVAFQTLSVFSKPIRFAY